MGHNEFKIVSKNGLIFLVEKKKVTYKCKDLSQ